MTGLRYHGDVAARGAALDFAVNIWPAPRPAGLQSALERSLRSTAYPDGTAARTALAARHGRKPEEVILGNGACELFWLLAHALRPQVAACIHPSFTEPEAALRAVGTVVTRVPRVDVSWRLDPAAVPADAELVVVGNPNNPTGTLDPAADLLSLARSDRVTVVDESFMDFVEGPQESLAGHAHVPGLVVVRSVTKLWSLAAIRAGYLLASPELAARLETQRQAWPVSAPACAALEWCASDESTPLAVAAEVARERDRLVAGLARLGLACAPAAANFLLFECADAPALVHALEARSVAVRPTASFPGLGPHHVRIAVRRRADNDRLLSSLAEVLAA